MAFGLFKKKEDDFDFSKFDNTETPGFNEGHNGLPADGDITANTRPQDDMGFNPNPSSFDELHKMSAVREAPAARTGGERDLGRDIELLGAKLDAVRAILDSVNHRLEKIERLAEQDKHAKW